VAALGWPWSVEVAPSVWKNRRRSASARRYPSQEPVSSPEISASRATFDRNPGKAGSVTGEHAVANDSYDHLRSQILISSF